MCPWGCSLNQSSFSLAVWPLPALLSLEPWWRTAEFRRKFRAHTGQPVVSLSSRRQQEFCSPKLSFQITCFEWGSVTVWYTGVLTIIYRLTLLQEAQKGFCPHQPPLGIIRPSAWLIQGFQGNITTEQCFELGCLFPLDANLWEVHAVGMET